VTRSNSFWDVNRSEHSGVLDRTLTPLIYFERRGEANHQLDPGRAEDRP